MSVPNLSMIFGNEYLLNLKVYDGPQETESRKTIFCGTTTPLESIYSSSDEMTIHFRTDVSINGRGFKASYITVAENGNYFITYLGLHI